VGSLLRSLFDGLDKDRLVMVRATRRGDVPLHDPKLEVIRDSGIGSDTFLKPKGTSATWSGIGNLRLINRSGPFWRNGGRSEWTLEFLVCHDGQLPSTL
jgi:hypothetical protein